MGKNYFQRWITARTRRADQGAGPSVEQLAQEGDAEAQFQLGLKYTTAEDPAGDENQAAGWYLKAAEQNHGVAQFNLGRMFASGEGVTQDAERSLFWYRRAAHLGIAGAQYNMGRACQRASMDGPGADAPESRIEAYVWYELAAAQNFPAAQGAYAQLTFKMTRGEVAEARRRVAVWPREPGLTPETAMPAVKS